MFFKTMLLQNIVLKIAKRFVINRHVKQNILHKVFLAAAGLPPWFMWRVDLEFATRQFS